MSNLHLNVDMAMERFKLTAEQLAAKDFNEYYTGSITRSSQIYKRGKSTEAELAYSRKLKELVTKETL